MKNMFEQADVDDLLVRINKLTSESERQWGKMNVSQMLAHCNVTYELVYENKHPKPKGVMKLILKFFVKRYVVSPKEYPKNSKTAPFFIIEDERDFESEKKRLVDYIIKTQKLGTSHFDHKESHSFGILSSNEWNTMFYKHLDHHLKQFGT